MAKQRKRRALNMKRRLRDAEQAEAGKPRNKAALALGLHFRDRNHGDARKEASRRACRGKVAA
jgi:hypothetical protein